jgi:hypothetical protein
MGNGALSGIDFFLLFIYFNVGNLQIPYAAAQLNLCGRWALVMVCTCNLAQHSHLRGRPFTPLQYIIQANEMTT